MSRQDQIAPNGRFGGFRWQTAVAVVAGLLALVFLLQNSQTVQVQFLFITLPGVWLWLLMLVMFVLGALFGGSLWDLIRRRMRKQ